MADTYKFIQLKDSTGNLYPIIDITNFALEGVKQTGTLATRAWVNETIAAHQHLTREIVDALPNVEDNPSTSVIYMVPLGTTGEAQNIYEEYLYVDQPATITGGALFEGKALRDGTLNKTVGGTTYYAWKADAGVFYTQTETPSAGDNLFTITDDDPYQEADVVGSYTEEYKGFELLGTTQVDISGKQDIIKAGTGINIADDGVTISVTTATADTAGIVQLSGDTLGDRSTVAATEKAVKDYVEATISGGTVIFNIQPATKTNIGGVIIGDNISVTADGTISVADATTASKGVVQIGTNISVSSGTISVADASSDVKGVVYISGDELGTSSTVAATEKAVQDAITSAIEAADPNITAGDNIQITAGTASDGSATTVISATDTTYITGEGLELTGGTVFSLKAAEKLSSGIDYTADTIPDVGGIVVGEHLSIGDVYVPDTSDGANENDKLLIENVLSVDKATNDTMGVVKAGTGVSITDGTLSTLLQYEYITDTPVTE